MTTICLQSYLYTVPVSNCAIFCNLKFKNTFRYINLCQKQRIENKVHNAITLQIDSGIDYGMWFKANRVDIKHRMIDRLPGHVTMSIPKISRACDTSFLCPSHIGATKFYDF